MAEKSSKGASAKGIGSREPSGIVTEGLIVLNAVSPKPASGVVAEGQVVNPVRKTETK